jgi:hypothetical protein
LDDLASTVESVGAADTFTVLAVAEHGHLAPVDSAEAGRHDYGRLG